MVNQKLPCELPSRTSHAGSRRDGGGPPTASFRSAPARGRHERGCSIPLPLTEPELRSRACRPRSGAGSARRWRAVFGGSPKTSCHSLFGAAKKVRTGTRGIGRAAQSSTRAACAPHFYFGVRAEPERCGCRTAVVSAAHGGVIRVGNSPSSFSRTSLGNFLPRKMPATSRSGRREPPRRRRSKT